MTIIDAHHHVWDLAVRDQDWITGEPMAPIRRSFTLDGDDSIFTGNFDKPVNGAPAQPVQSVQPVQPVQPAQPAQQHAPDHTPFDADAT